MGVKLGWVQSFGMFSAVLQHFFPKFGENITAFCEEQKLCMYTASSYGYKCGSFIALCADTVMPICYAIQAGSFWLEVCNLALICISFFLSTSACFLPGWN